MTSTGLVLMPLLCLAMLLGPRSAILACVVATVLNDGAVIDSGGRLVSVEWFAGLLLIGRALVEIGTGRAGLRPDILQRLVPLMLYALSCAASLLVALALFKGEILVLPGSASLNRLLAEPYRLMPENINQLVYVLLILLFVYAMAQVATGLATEELERAIDVAMRCSCGLATAIVAWFIASRTTGLPFASDFLHSGSHAGAWDQAVAGVPRPSGSFAEPSALSYFFSAHLFYFWQRVRRTGRPVDQLFWLITMVVLLISTASSAFLILGVFVLLAAADRLLAPRPERAKRPGGTGPALRLGHALMALVLVALIVAGWQLVQSHGDVVRDFVDEQLLNKHTSLSYEVRSNADRMAWQIFLDSYGLGLGFGSHRPSSGLLSLLVGPGVIGTLLFGLFVLSVLRAPATAEAARASKAIRWAAIGPLVSHLMTVPDFQGLVLWLPLALSLAMHLSVPRTASLLGAGAIGARAASKPAGGTMVATGPLADLTAGGRP